MKRYAYGWITALIDEIDRRYLRVGGHAKPHAHGDLGHE